MKYSLFPILLFLGLTPLLTAQEERDKNSLSTALETYYYFDGSPIATAAIPLNLAYERRIGDHYAARAKLGMYGLNYMMSGDKRPAFSGRFFSTFNLGVRRYFDVSDNLRLFASLNLSARAGNLWKEHHSVRYNDWGVGIGFGARYTFWEHFFIEGEVRYTKYFGSSNDRFYPEGSDILQLSRNQLSTKLSLGWQF